MAQLMVEIASGDRITCRPVGDLDLVGAQLLRGAATGMLATAGSIVVDLSEVTFIDSAGLSALVGLARRCNERGGQVCFVGPRRSVARVLAMTGVDRLLGMPPAEPPRAHQVPLHALERGAVRRRPAESQRGDGCQGVGHPHDRPPTQHGPA